MRVGTPPPVPLPSHAVVRAAMLAIALHVPLAALADAPDLVAVLPLDVQGSGIDPSAVHAMEEGIRNVAGEELQAAGYTVLTGETTLRLLADNGVDPGKACEASCALDTARELKAKLFLSGSITVTEGEYVAFVRLFDGVTGRQLASTELVGAAVKELRGRFNAEAKSFFSKALQALRPAAADAGRADAGRTDPGRKDAAQEAPPARRRRVELSNWVPDTNVPDVPAAPPPASEGSSVLFWTAVALGVGAVAGGAYLMMPSEPGSWTTTWKWAP